MGEKLKLCLGCMEPKTDDGICPNCGYSNNAPYLPSYIAPGKILNERYLVGKLLSYNGEGATYLAYDSVTNRKNFIKEYMPDTLCNRVKGSSIISVNQNNLVQYKAFMSEFTELNKVLAKMRTLNHINPALDLFAENNTTYVVFDYVEGITLKEYLQENAGELSWDEVKKLFPPIFTTLSLVHNAGIIHRGISLDTIWYTSREELLLTGFCITASRTANTELASEMYAGYAAPEQYSSSNWQGTWTDVYAISAVLYRILTGCMPTEAISRIGNDNLCEPALINPNIPSNVSKVIMSGLKLSGDMRIQTVTELVTKLFEQPDYLEQRLNRTATIAIPKQQVRTQSLKDNKKASKPNSKLERLKVPLTVGIVTLAILGIAAIVSAIFLSNSNPDTKNSQISDTTLTEMMPAETTSSTEDTADKNVAGLAKADNSLPKDYEMPKLEGLVYDLIKNSDSYSFLIMTPEESEYNDQYPIKGTIISQSIPEGQSISKDTEVKLKVSLGAKLVAVPDFHGLTVNDYIAKLGDIKYTIIEQQDPGFVAGYIINTSKDVGQNIDVSIGEILTIFVSKGSDGIINSSTDPNQ